ncbi:ABC transporter permease [Flaviflexus equikiangi]|uniref:ABC transporter permease n=1 Tax=Flaviflexus equikiangi TaxID=2758573 RepID=A0ABS2TFA5_9ACTO|nr:ABC transporter permease [Flaviflexus equikiangi]MBM9432191.1 ABC transporter permease [Flaviflexus equikiangi]
MTWLSYSWGHIADLLLIHLAITIPPILISILIAVPIGRLAFRYPRLGGPLLSASTLLYAIPALPLLIIIPVLFGTSLRSSATITIALTVYGVALLVRSAADGFESVDPAVRQAALAVGYSKRHMLWLVDLPLATPVIVSGIRVVTVSTVGLTTIGALVGIQSLGSLFTDGFQRDIPASIVTGIVLTVIVALALDALVQLIGYLLTPWTRAGSSRGVGVS